VRKIGFVALIVAASVCWTASDVRADAAPRPDDAASLQVEDEGSGNALRRGGHWDDDFESYANGSSMHGQGDWQGWDGDNTWTAFVTQVQAHGGLQSVDIRTDADLVHPFSGYSSGVWNLSVWQYVPAGFTGANGSYFIVQKEYNDGGPYQWSIQMQTHDDGSIHCDCGAEDNGNPMNWIPDAWNHIEAEIDLDGDSVTLWYNGSELGTYPWTTGVFGNDSGCPLGGCIGAIDLFAFGTTSVYYDDFDLSQASECGTSCEGDANSDGTVDPLDAGFVLARFGCNVGTGDSGCDDADQNCDGAVDPLDSGFVLARFGPCD